MLEFWFGKASWPIVVLAVAITAALTVGYFKTENDKANLKKEVVHTCASTKDPVSCANNLAKAVNSVN